MAVHVVLLAVPAVAGGFLQAFKFAFLLWPFNLALPLARHLPRACIALRGVAAFYAAELRRYFAGARAAAGIIQQPPTPRSAHLYADASPQGSVQRRATTHVDVVAHAMNAFNDIY